MRLHAWMWLSAVTVLASVTAAGAWMAAAASSSSSSSAKPTDMALEVVGPSVIDAGMTAKYQFVIKNKGKPYSGPGRLSIKVPGGFKLIFSSYVTCDQFTSGTLDCLVRNISSDQDTKVNMSFSVSNGLKCTASGTLKAALTVFGDTNRTNDTKTRTLDLNCLPKEPSLSIALTGAQSTTQGSRLTYTIKLKNSGLTAAHDVRLRGVFAGTFDASSTNSCVGGVSSNVEQGDGAKHPSFVFGCFLDEVKALSTKTITVSMTAPTVRFGTTCTERNMTQTMDIVQSDEWPASRSTFKTLMRCP